MKEIKRNIEIAVVGMGCRFPGGANDPDKFWQLLVNGENVITEIPASRFDMSPYFDAQGNGNKSYTQFAGLLDGDPGQFDAAFFNISPREAAQIDPQHRLLLEVTAQALENAGIPRKKFRGSKTAVFVGITSNDYCGAQNFSGDLSKLGLYSLLGNMSTSASGRISHVFDLKGPSMSIDTACSSSLVAIHLAMQSLQRGECDMAIAGGVNLLLNPVPFAYLSKIGTLSKSGRCHSFSALADGYVRAEGCGMVVLRKKTDAVKSRNRIHALLMGSAVSHNGSGMGLTTPNAEAQQAAICDAISDAGVNHLDIRYLEAHGTGTPMGDPVEIQGINEVYGRDRPLKKPLFVGSLKSNMGHLEAAAGVAGLIKTIQTIKYGLIPASLNFDRPNSIVPWNEIPLKIPVKNEQLHWKSGNRHAAVSSFGITGTNAHLIVRDYEIKNYQPALPRLLENKLLLLSAKDETSLKDQVRAMVGFLKDDISGVSDNRIAYSSAVNRSHYHSRLAVAGSNRADWIESLQLYAKSMSSESVHLVDNIKADLETRSISGLVLCIGEVDSKDLKLDSWPSEMRAKVAELSKVMVKPASKWSLAPVFQSSKTKWNESEDKEAFAAQLVFIQWMIYRGLPVNYVVGSGNGICLANHLAGKTTWNETLKMAASQHSTPKPCMPLLVRDEGIDFEDGRWLTLSVGAAECHMDMFADRFVSEAMQIDMGGDPESTLRDLLAKLYVRGTNPDWLAWYGGTLQQPVDLPAYIFRKDRHWIDPTGFLRRNTHEKESVDIAETGPQSIAGHLIELPGSDLVFERKIVQGKDKFIDHHIINGFRIIPVALFFRTAEYAAKKVLGDVPIDLENIRVVSSVIMSAGAEMRLITKVEQHANSLLISVWSKRQKSAEVRAKWQLHFETVARPTTEGNLELAKSQGISTRMLKRKLKEELNGAAFYDLVLKAGYAYSGPFHCAQNVWRSPIATMAEFDLKAATDFAEAQLDNCIQTSLGCYVNRNHQQGNTYILLSVKRCFFGRDIPEKCFTYFKIKKREDDRMYGDLKITDAQGDLCVFMGDCEAQILALDKIQIVDQAGISSFSDVVNTEMLSAQIDKIAAPQRLEWLSGKILHFLADILDVPASTLNPDESFRKLGMDSLSNAKFMDLINKSLNVTLEASFYLDHPTSKELAGHLMELNKLKNA